MIKLIASDMDCTFLDEHSKIPEGSFELIRELAQEGVRFCVSSGRWPGFIQELFVPVASEIDMICCNGGVVYAAGECISWTPYNLDDVNRLADFADQFDAVHFVANDGKQNYLLDRSQHKIDRALELYAKFGDEPVVGLPEGVEIMAAGFPCSTPEDALIYASAFTLEMGDTFNFLPLGVPYFDAVPRETTKATGLQIIMEHYGIERDEVLCYGDSINDYAMMRAAGHARAPENAYPVIKDICERIVPSHIEHGVQQDMRRILAEAHKCLP